ncbi:MAG: amidase [Chloroflexi bacterium]|nr:amidase [Chloroflexota bacterium]
MAILELAAILRQRQVSVAEVVAETLERISAASHYEAFISTTEHQARARAEALDRELAHGDYRGLLHGIPICWKDNIEIRGTRTTCGSLVRAGAISSTSASIYDRLAEEGSICVGKTQLYEFAYGPHVSAFGVPKNPVDARYATGGSSSGTAVAVAANLCFGGIGTDTGGSIRLPAAYCGLVGLKPTKDLVPVDGIIPLSPSLDVAGPIARTIDDVDVMFQALLDQQARLRLYGHKEVSSAFENDVRGFRVGVINPDELVPLDDSIKHALLLAADTLERSGAEIVECAAPALDVCQAADRLILRAEAFAWHEPFLKALREKYDPTTWDKLAAGGVILAQDYLRSVEARRILSDRYFEAWAGLDALLLPTSPCVPPMVGGDDVVAIGGQRYPFYSIFSRYTFFANFLGIPALTVPFGHLDGFPLAVQIIGPRLSEPKLLQVGKALQSEKG